MKKKLKRRFISAAMISVFVVLSSILIIINVNNYYNYKNISLQALESYEIQDTETVIPNNENNKFNSNIKIIVYDTETGLFNDPMITIFEPEIVTAVENIDTSGTTSGNIDSVFYDVEGNNIYLVNATREYTMYANFRDTSLIAALVGLVIVYILLAITSNRVIAPIVEAYDKQKKFITNASHELKTPLSVIMTNNEVMEMDYGDNPYIKSTENQVIKLTELVNSLVSLSKLEEDFKLHTTKVNIEKILVDVVSDYEIVSDAKNHPFEMKLEKTSAAIDEKLFRQLIAILLDNAMKYSADNSIITIQLTKNQLSIENDAYDLDDGDHSEVFERFYTKDVSHNSKTSGHGIGLSLAQQITELHKMKITATVLNNKFKISILF